MGANLGHQMTNPFARIKESEPFLLHFEIKPPAKNSRYISLRVSTSRIDEDGTLLKREKLPRGYHHLTLQVHGADLSGDQRKFTFDRADFSSVASLLFHFSEEGAPSPKQ
jgi:hypothetical protein